MFLVVAMAAAVVISLATGVRPAFAADFTVGSPSDEHLTNPADVNCVAPSGCTLRAALEAADNRAAAGTLTTSIFVTFGFGTYNLNPAFGALTVGGTPGESVSITGQNVLGLTISQSVACVEVVHQCNVFFLDPGDVGNITVSISNLILTGGHSSQPGGGGGILGGSVTAPIGDTTTITNCSLNSNSSGAGGQGGGAISYAHGTLTVANSFINNNAATGGNGGGIDFADLLPGGSTLNVSNTEFFNNTSTATLNGGGGAIHMLGLASTYSVTGSYFVSNSAPNATGPGGGGAILKESGTLTATANVFNGNSTGGAGGAVNTEGGNTDLGHTGVPGLNRFVGNSATGSGQAVFYNTGNPAVVTGEENWWSTNTPGAAVAANVALTRWVVLGLSASPAFVARGGSTALTGDLSHDNLSSSPFHVGNAFLDFPVGWSQTNGSLSAQTTPLDANYQATATYTAGGVSGTGTASVTVDGYTKSLNIPILFPPTVAKAFGAASIPLNGSTSLTFTVTNPNSVTGLTGVGFSDTLPAGLVVSTPNGLTGSCGAGTITATQGTGTISLSGGSIPLSSSCSFSVNVTGTTAGTKNNTTAAPTSTEAGAGVPSNTAVINVVAPPDIAKAFNPTSVAVNGTSGLQFTITNPAANAVALTGVGFTDTLPAGLTVANASATVCGGTLTTAAPTGITLAGATVAVNSNCQFTVTVTGAVAGSYTNTTGAVTSTNGGTGNAASANLVVVVPPTITKSFGAASVPVGGSTSLSFTITNPNSAAALTGVGFNDSLPAGLVVATPNGLTGSCGGGTITAVAASGTVSLSGATLITSASCSFSVNVTGATAGVKNNSTQVTSTEGGNGNTTNASMTVVAPPTMSKAFGAASIPLNGTTSLTFTIGNPNAGTTLTGVGFTDTLPAGLVVATPNGVGGTCTGASTATAGSSTVDLSGGSIAASGSCTFFVNVTGTTAGTKVNTSGSVTSTEGGTGGTATASVDVVAPPAIAKAFNPNVIAVGATTSLQFTIDNANAFALTGVAFSDTLPSGLTVANAGATVCGGSLTTTNPTGISLTGATVAGSGQCVFSVTVTGAASAIYTNTTGAVTSTNGGTGNTASANLIVASPPVITKSFGAASVPLNGSTSLSFAITNPNGSIDLNGVAFTDNLPAGLVVAATPALTSDCGGTATATAGSSTVTLSGGNVTSNCTVSLNVTGTTTGVKNNSVQVTSTEGGNGNTSNASITVAAPPTIAKSFGAGSMPVGGTTSLQFTISNPNNSAALTGVGFSDTLPAGLLVATPNGLAGTCGGGTITATAGTNNISLSGATLAASASCTFSVNVTGTAGGDQVNTTGNVGSTEGGTGGTATATINVVAPPTIAKAFGAAHITINGTTSLTFTLSNPVANTVSLSGVGFTDTLPAGLVVSTPNNLTGSCGGGVIVATSGSTVISLSGATLAPSLSCSFSVNISGTVSADYVNSTGSVSSTNGGSGAAATANLQVANPPTITVTFNPTSIALNGKTTFTIKITNPALNLVALTGVGFNDPPPGLQVDLPNNLVNTCGGTASAVPGQSHLSLSGGTIAVGSSCTFSVTLVGVAVGTQTDTVTVFSDQGLSGAVSASVAVLGASPESNAPPRPQPLGLLLGLAGLLFALLGAIAVVARRRRVGSIR